MRLAAIDLGTNTVRLLVVDVEADGGWRLVEQDQRVTRLGEGLASSRQLGQVPMERTAATVAEYVGRARAAGAGDIRIVATSAVREAANGADFAASLRGRTGARVDVISGADEARLTLAGVLRGLGSATGSLVVFDIGGGSTEYIAARDGEYRAAVSLLLGVVPLAERYPFPGPVDESRYRAMSGEVARQLATELSRDVLPERIDRLVGTAGTVTTLAALDLGLQTYDATRVQGHVLHRDAVESLRDRLAGLTVAERAALPCLEPGRADLIIPGVAIVLETMTRLSCDRLTVSDAGLREGLLAHLTRQRK